eukprot:COSAG02_NODE_6145_length_3768_cov_8.162442_2_plen_95_part_00
MCEKLVPNLNDKTQYVVDVRNLKFYVEHGLIVRKVHKVITFEQRRWMKPYIDFNEIEPFCEIRDDRLVARMVIIARFARDTKFVYSLPHMPLVF